MRAAASRGMSPWARLRFGERRFEVEHGSTVGLRAEMAGDFLVAEQPAEIGVIEGGKAHARRRRTNSRLNTCSSNASNIQKHRFPLALQMYVEGVDVFHRARR